MDGFERRHSGGSCSVWFSDQALKQLTRAKFDAKDIRRADNILKKVSDGEEDLPPQQWKHEGWFRSGKPNVAKVAVYAVKAYQLRIYGGFISDNKGRKFLCIEVAKKKEDRADANQLDRVASKLGEYHE